jgi:hypothetical protein
MIGGLAPSLVLIAPPASAQEPGESTAVVVEGPGGEEVAVWLEDHVQAPDTLVESDAFRGALRARGALPLHLATGSSRRDALLIARARSAAREHNVDRAVLVDVTRTATATRAHVWVVELRHPGALVDSEVSLPPAASTIDQTRAILGLLRAPATSSLPADDSVEARAASPAATPAAAPVTPAAAPETPDRTATTAGPHGVAPLLSLQAALGVGMRHFSYVDRVTPALRPYDLDAAPLASITATVYPFAFTGAPVVRDLGLTGEYAQAVGITSQDSTGAHVDTSWRTFDVGAVERIPLTRSVMAHVSAGYGGNDFQFGQSLASATLPGVGYRFLRIGGDVDVGFLSDFDAFAGGSYLDILETGATGQIFPRESVGGLEAHVGLSYALSPHWQASIGAAYTRFFYSFNPVPGDVNVAGGALDEQTRALAAFAYRL